jgi:predicted GIY-YIG superfamily endonuclease
VEAPAPSPSAGSQVAPHRTAMPPKRFVYILESQHLPPRYYTGVTSDVPTRLVAHNQGHCRHTAGGRPWHLDVVVEFADEQRALAFERYLKSGSGSAFAKRHLRPNGHPLGRRIPRRPAAP